MLKKNNVLTTKQKNFSVKYCRTFLGQPFNIYTEQHHLTADYLNKIVYCLSFQKPLILTHMLQNLLVPVLPRSDDLCVSFLHRNKTMTRQRL